jgi:hypothetical protein
MEPRDEAIDLEARALWRRLREDPPPDGLTGADLLQILIAQAGELRYDRYVSPHLRESQITRPRNPASS